MTEITREEFTAAEGTEDWRIVISGPCAFYRTPDYRTAIALVEAVAALGTDELEPEFEVRARAVLVRLPAPERRVYQRHLSLAKRISELVRDLPVTPDPTAIQDFQLAFDAEDWQRIRGFWAAALGFEPIRETHLRSPDRIGPTFFVQEKAYRAPRNRIHIDLSLPPDQAEARIAAILAAGGRLLGDRNAPMFWSFIDPEGNVLDIATWAGREPGN